MPKRSKLSVLEDIPNKMLKKLQSSRIFIGGHVSMKGGLFNSFKNANDIGAKAFAIFLSNQRQWTFKSISDEDVNKFREGLSKSDVSTKYIVPHGNYLLNCGSPKEEILKKSRNLLIKELQICDQLGLTYYNFHPGSTCGLISKEESIEKIAHSINTALSKSKIVTVLIENMCGQGNTIGGNFQELYSIILLVKDKARIGVCLDTCHAFAAGYPLHTTTGYDKLFEDFEKIIGLKYLKALHLNDSKVECGQHTDRHEDIGNGKIGLPFFKKLVNDMRLRDMPMILETPGFENYQKQIALLYSLIDDTPYLS